MTARILDGKALAAEIRTEIAAETATWLDGGGPVPCLAAVLVGEDPASQVYVRNKQRACEKTGMTSRLIRLAVDCSQQQLMATVAQLNGDAGVHGILVQLPLPRGLEEQPVLDAVDPLKDVDCFSPENVGLMLQQRPRFVPCTPHGVLQILARSGIAAAGKHVVVIGRSEIVGKPLALMLAMRDGPCGPDTANATVTLAHSRTADLSQVVRGADIVVAAVGKAELVRGSWLKPGCTVIDVGINRVGDQLVGDVCFAEASAVAGAITPVPGGVGPLTIAMLLKNTLTAARLQQG